MNGRSGRRRIGDALDAFLEALQAFAQSLAQFRQPFRAEEQKSHNTHDHNMPRCKFHCFVLHERHGTAAQSHRLLSHNGRDRGSGAEIRENGKGLRATKRPKAYKHLMSEP